MPLLVPVPDIPTVEANGKQPLGVRQRLAVCRAAGTCDSLVLSPLFLTASGHGKGVMVGGGRVQGPLYREQVLQDPSGHPIREQRRPPRPQEEQGGCRGLSEEGGQRTTGGRFVPLTPAVREPRTGEEHRAKEGT